VLRAASFKRLLCGTFRILHGQCRPRSQVRLYLGNLCSWELSEQQPDPSDRATLLIRLATRLDGRDPLRPRFATTIREHYSLTDANCACPLTGGEHQTTIGDSKSGIDHEGFRHAICAV